MTHEQGSPASGRRSYRADPAYLARECGAANAASVVRAGDACGLRWKHGPLRFERHTGDAEPVLDPSGPLRLVVWQPERGMKRPKGWLPGLPKMSVGRTGHVKIDEGCEKEWPSHARRHLARWRRQAEWTIAPTTLEPFLASYRFSTQDRILRMMFGVILKEKIRDHGDRVRLYAASRGGEIGAGFVCVDVPETGESLHLISFIRSAARESSAGIGLMDHWFRTSLERGFGILDFGLFWRKGEPRSWQGFSKFKSQFVTDFIDYPTPFLRFAGRWGAADPHEIEG